MVEIISTIYRHSFSVIKKLTLELIVAETLIVMFKTNAGIIHKPFQVIITHGFKFVILKIYEQYNHVLFVTCMY